MFLSGFLSYNDKIAYTYSKKLKSFKSTSMSPYLSHAISTFNCHLSSFSPGTDKTLPSIKAIHFLKSNDPWPVHVWVHATSVSYLYYLEKTHAHDLWRLIYQVNKHLLTNHNKGIVLLIGLRNWRPRRQWNPCSIFVRAIHTGYRKLSNLTVYWELQRLFLDQLIVYKDFVKIFHDFRLANPQ